MRRHDANHLGTYSSSSLAAAASCRTDACCTNCTNGRMKWKRSCTPCLSGSPSSASQSWCLLLQQRRKANECHRMVANGNEHQLGTDRYTDQPTRSEERRMTYDYPINPQPLRIELAKVEKEIAWNEHRLVNLVFNDEDRQQTEDFIADLRKERERLLAVLNG